VKSIDKEDLAALKEKLLAEWEVVVKKLQK